MYLLKISIVNYKNIREAELTFSPKINCLLGNNGMGKTNLLDAIYYLSFCKSHTNSIDNQNITHNEDFFMINGNYVFGDKIENIYCAIKPKHKKQFKRNKKEYERLSDHIGLLPLVMVSPNDSALISEGSDERRKFIDGVIAQINSTYLSHLVNYNNALKQRNALLKNELLSDDSLLDIWEEQMLFHGAYIHQQRREFIDEFTPIFQEYYSQIASTQEQISLKYISQYADRDMSISIKQTRDRDRILGYSSQGIHKDDLEMNLLNHPIKRIGSQGQNKTYLIALKFAQYEFLKRVHQKSPIILLDDIFDKLDTQRVEKIVQLVSDENFGQIFITDTNRDHLDSILSRLNQETNILYVDNGIIK